MLRVRRFGTIDQWAGGDNLRSEHLPRRCLFSPSKYIFSDPSHVADTQDAVGDKHREIALRILSVNVHIPQGGNQEFARRLDDQRSTRNLYGFARTDFDDPVVCNQDRTAWMRRCFRRVDDRYMS